jgi:hypothetical protein
MRFSTLEIDRVLTEASPRGLVRPIQYVTEKGALTRSLAGIKQISEESWKRPVVPAPVNTHQKEHRHE